MRVDTLKLKNFLDYLQMGGKMTIEGKTFVWLNNYTVSETDTHTFVIDGLAIEGQRYRGDELVGSCYTGAGHISLQELSRLLDKVDLEDYRVMCLELNKMKNSEVL